MSDLRTRRKKWRERKSVISVVLIILFVVLLTAVIMVWKLRSFIREEICTTKECVESAHLFLELIGRDTDPCSNFYNFTCRGYKGDLIVRNLQNAVDKKVKALITGDIEDDDSKSVKTQKKYYLACMDLASIEEDQDETLKNIFRKLGDWPVLTGEKWNETEFHWDKIIEKCQDNGLYYDWFISIDKADDENRLKVSPPDNTNEIKINLMQAYVDLMTKVVRKLGAPGNLSNISESMREVMMFEKELSKIIQTSHDDDDAELSLDDIIRRFPETPWYSIFKHVVLPEHEKIIFNVDIYLSKLQGLLERTQYRVQANYIFWKLIEPFSAFFTRSIRKEFETYAHLSRRYSYPNNRQEYCYSITSTVYGIHPFYFLTHVK